MHLRRRRGRRRWRARRVLRVSACEPVVVLARVTGRLSVPVGTGRLRVGGPLLPMPVTLAARPARSLRKGLVHRDLRCGLGERSRSRGRSGRAPRDPNPCAWMYPMRVGNCLLPPRHEVLGRRSGDLTDWLRGAVVNGGREIRDHPPSSSADRGQQRRRLAPDPGAVEQEHRQRYPHRRNENGGDGRRQMSEHLHSRVSAVATVR